MKKFFSIFSIFAIHFALCFNLAFSQGTWSPKASFPAANRFAAVTFSIGNKGYFGTGMKSMYVSNVLFISYLSDFWELDPVANTWTQKASFGGGQRSFAVGFSIGNKGYIGTGEDQNGFRYNDFWQYDPVANNWTQTADFGGSARVAASGFSIGGMGYLGTGMDSGTVYYNDFWKFDPVANSWTQLGNFPGTPRANIYSANFVIGNKAYWGTGLNTLGYSIYVAFNDFWEYDPSVDTWTQKADFPATARGLAMGFSICNKGFLGLGVNENSTAYYNDLWMYDPVSDTWSAAPNLPASSRCDAPSFVVNNIAYLGTGVSDTIFGDFWEYTIGTKITVTASDTIICQGSNVTLTASGGIAYAWSNGSTDNPVIITPTSSSIYSANETTVGCPGSGNIFIDVLTVPTASVTGNSTICSGVATTLNAFGGTSYSWNTGETSSSITVAPNTNTTYFVIANNICGSDSVSKTITVPAMYPAIAGNTSICAGNSEMLVASGGISFSWNTGATTQGISITPSTTTTYSVMVTNSKGCTADTSIIVTASPSPVASFTYQSDVCGVLFIDSSLNAISWNWNFGDGNTSSTQQPSHIYLASGNYLITLVVTNSIGCSNTKQILLDVPAFLYIPTGFSPNGDNNNDVYYVFGKCITEMTFIIYDRWGEEVFRATDVTKGWDGTYKGKKENSGVFMYSFEGTLTTGEKINKKGNITLMR